MLRRLVVWWKKRRCPFGPSSVHSGDEWAGRFSLSGFYDWHPPLHPRFANGVAMSWWTCGYCGSMHPRELANAIGAGATVEWADRKYGWPHKVYVENAPNRYAGAMEQTVWRSDAKGKLKAEKKESAPKRTRGKFYTLHLQDATASDRLTIERAMCLSFDFSQPGKIGWKSFEEPGG